jgi:hypothetical protein
MENNVEFNNKIYKGQLLFKNNFFGENDYKENSFILPKEQKKWNSQNFFIKRIKKINNLIDFKKPDNIIKFDKSQNCLLCNKKNISNKFYILDNFIWDENIVHYIEKHNVKPNDEFLDFIFNLDANSIFNVNLNGTIYIEKECEYIKLEKNQIMILDALMRHGGYTKKYYDRKNKNISRYSEHAGFLEISDKILQEIIVSGNTVRVDKGDEEIYLPGDMPKSLNYYYSFHTHPPTPKPGGRANDGILYEFPSIGDLFFFVEHYNMGKIIGSLVLTPEGLYNIRKYNVDNTKKINLDENKFYNDIRKICYETHKKAVNLFGTEFTTYEFYSVISQEKKFIDNINEILNKYELHIDFFPRTKDFKNNWIIDDVYLPIYDKKK